MNWIDWVLLILFLLSFLSGLRSGLISRVCNVAGLVFGLLMGKIFAPSVALFLQAHFSPIPADMLPFASRAVVIILFIIAGALVGGVLGRGINKTPLSVVNKVLGGVLATALSVFAFSVLFTTIDAVCITAKEIKWGRPKSDPREHSLLYQPVQSFFPAVISLCSSPNDIESEETIQDNESEKFR